MAIGRAGIRIGRFFAPAVKPAAFTLPIAAAGLGTIGIARSVGEARNPPLQHGVTDPDATRSGDETAFLFDPRTGSLFTTGAPVQQQQDEQRSQDRNRTTLLVAGVAAVGLVAVFALRK